jgi:hypothetical protein
VDEKSGENTLKIMKKKNDPYNLETRFTHKESILRESNVYKVRKPLQHPPTLWRIGGISHFLSSPLLFYTMKHTHTSPKATMPRGWERDD